MYTQCLQAVPECQVRVDNALICKIDHSSSYLYGQFQCQFRGEWLHTKKKVHIQMTDVHVHDIQSLLLINLAWNEINLRTPTHACY